MAASGWFILMCNVYFFSTQIRRVVSPFDFVCMFVSSIQPFVLKQVTLPFLHHDGSDKRVLPIVITFAILAIFPHIFHFHHHRRKGNKKFQKIHILTHEIIGGLLQLIIFISF